LKGKNMSQRKFLSEFGLNMMSDYMVILQQDGFSEVDKKNYKPHIYIVGRRPRITIDAASVKFTNNRVTGRFKKQIRDTFLDIPFDVPNQLGTEEVKLESPYPDSEFKVVASNGEVCTHGKSALLMASFGPAFWEHLDLEVVYVGQAFGANGKRIATDRLVSHSTLQSIYAEVIRQSPDQEVWIDLSSFKEFMLASFDGRSKSYGTTIEEDSEHIERVTNMRMTKQQKINFTEAAMIRYFKPEFNEKFKESFPSPFHSTYQECYDLDLNMVAFELPTEAHGFRFWSPSVKADYVHIGMFPLHSAEERRAMFDVI
jgi:hypothetical protein